MKMILLYTIYVIEEIVKYCLVYYGVLNLEITKDVKRYFCAILVVLATVGVNVWVFDMDYSTILLISRFICISLLIQCSWRTKILAFIPIFFGINLMDIAIFAVSGWVLGFNFLILLQTENIGKQLVESLPSCAILCAMSFLNRTRKKNVKYVEKITGVQYIIISFGVSCSALLITFVSYMIYNDNAWKLDWFKGLFTVVVMEAMITFTLFVLYINELIERHRLQDEKMFLYEKQHILQKKYYQKLYEQNENLRKIQHDYRHHIHFLKKSLWEKQYEQALAYIYQLEERVKNQKINIVYSGNNVIDSVICGVLENTDIQGIHFEYQGKLKRKIGVADVDICVLLANALENAVEACGRKNDNRYIQMKIATYKSYIFISICNSCKKSQIVSEDRWRTEKRVQDIHGYGMKNMQEIVKRYNGNLKYEEKEEEVIVKIYLEEKEII